MTLNRRQTLALLAGATTLPARAQGFEQARILYGFPAGSSGDVAARRIAERLGGSPYAKLAPIVENRVGAGGRIALEALKTLPADGSVLALTPMATTAIYPHVYRRLGYDPVVDLIPVSTAVVSHHGMAVGPAVPASVTTVKGFVAWAKANPDKASYGSPAAGSTPHFLGALLGLGQDVELRHIPYRGSMPGVTDLVGGQIAAMFTPTGDFLNFHRAGKLRLLATSGHKRLPFAPDVPTFAEQGLGDLSVEEWYGFYATARSPQPVLATAHGAIQAALKDRSLIEALSGVGLLVQGSTPEQMTRSQREEFERWGPLIKRIGFTADS
ncbi:Bug family tripartite tricarboxylate transporter substrate binding protein [Paucibacter sp. PLA-PC-4]|uniref:Bug family tripartite tricarboxylate transporter substrate binding protein n=1 Tax=Paucibacter sp. PLA-PC-4 TaxID=2993655 RepID=UPI002249A19E|nr:Bug family tripartite tricarboxylate transporter substrate binding protein [Paucibacter sp. PLA-PC-4]MCX2863363.1 Bug family tripartite tricarboxylate transporter substrate binding protein [Paucibacter sp. PLA-PC-4]